MEAASHGKHICEAINNINKAVEILDEGVAGVISESVALICADTALLIAKIELGRAMESITKREDNIKLEKGEHV